MGAQCNPLGEAPCCSDWYIGQCGSKKNHCSCPECIDYGRIFREWRESRGTKKWRYDDKCGSSNPLPDGTRAECDPNESRESYCCTDSNIGLCYGPSVCMCPNCIDYRVVKALRDLGKVCSAQEINGFLKKVCFNNHTGQQYQMCTHSDTNYTMSYIYATGLHLEGMHSVDTVCENDPYVYQACGFGDHEIRITNTNALCGGYFCLEEESGKHHYVQCSGDECMIENRNCKIENERYKTLNCNDKCDSSECEDESVCNGYRYGMFCNSNWMPKYIPVYKICNSNWDCQDGEDERGCRFVETKNTAGKEIINNCKSHREQTEYNQTLMVPLLNYTRCSVFSKEFNIYPYCFNYYDQTNCTDINKVGGFCLVNGFNTSISKYMVSYDYDESSYLPIKLCDDDIQKKCFNLSIADCKLHKHKMCDENLDCLDKGDEIHDMCSAMTDHFNFTCTRRFNPERRGFEIPLTWVMDNVTDCTNGEDEDPTKWNFCNGDVKQIYIPGQKCNDAFKCPHRPGSLVLFEQLCDGIDSCGDGSENIVCRIARDFPSLNKTAAYNGRRRSICHGAACEVKEFSMPWGSVFGVSKLAVLVPVTKIRCSDLFGEYYIFLSCLDLCLEPNIICPLKSENRTLDYNSCPQQYGGRIYTLANNSFITFVVKSNDGQFHQDLFRCNNNICINYNQVCDLIDDCGDMSDEAECKNHMICEDTINSSQHQLISLSQKCDGIYDCFDLSDECNSDCGRQILGNWGLKIICWLMGILAAGFNVFAVFHGLSSFGDRQTAQMLTSNVLMVLIAFGDFLIGLYLIGLSIYDDIIFGKNYCRHQPEWLTGTGCLTLGIISTVGSQTSLFSMTVMSCIRMYGLTCNSMAIPRPAESAKNRLALLAIVILAASITVAFTPLSKYLEDYFVKAMYYDPAYKLFIGFPNKDRHVNILSAYFDQKSTSNTSDLTMDLSWEKIGKKVDSLFTHDHGHLERYPVHFYGNDGICLFKYFVRTDDARRSRDTRLNNSTNIIIREGDAAVWTMLAVNLFCFIVIATCYIVIATQNKTSTQRSGQQHNPNRLRDDRAVQRRITMIIITDFLCWVPFIIISGLHNLGVIDATSWYLGFSMIVLPLNSVINPLIYDRELRESVERRFRIISKFRLVSSDKSQASAELSKNIPMRLNSDKSSIFSMVPFRRKCGIESIPFEEIIITPQPEQELLELKPIENDNISGDCPQNIRMHNSCIELGGQNEGIPQNILLCQDYAYTNQINLESLMKPEIQKISKRELLRKSCDSKHNSVASSRQRAHTC